MLGVLLEENDAETRPVAPQYTLPGEYTEMEISRVALYGQVRLPLSPASRVAFADDVGRLWTWRRCGCSCARPRRTSWRRTRRSGAGFHMTWHSSWREMWGLYWAICCTSPCSFHDRSAAPSSSRGVQHTSAYYSPGLSQCDGEMIVVVQHTVARCGGVPRRLYSSGMGLSTGIIHTVTKLQTQNDVANTAPRRSGVAVARQIYP